MRIVKFMLLFLLGIVATVAIVASIYISRALNISIDPIIYYNPQLTTQFYDRNGELIANLFSDENRIFVPFNEIPSRLVEALVAIEDTSFFEHKGLNYEAIFRAGYRVAMAGKAVEGASTITQQLVKNLLLTRDKTIDRKLKEAILSLRIEQKLTKEEIIERYFNAIYLGHGYYGIKTASHGYFRKPLKELTLKEMALLAGLPRAPSFYDPTKHFQMSLTRANLVIDRMFTLGWISEEEYKAALIEMPTIYNDTLTKNRAPYAVDAIVHLLSQDYPDLKTGGYEVYTTIDIKMQEAAESALLRGYEITKNRAINYYKSSLARYNKLIAMPSLTQSESEDLAKAVNALKPVVRDIDQNATIDDELLELQLKEVNGALVTINQQNGELLALLGGVDYKSSVYNRAFQSKRQLGSSFKPFIYLAAFDLGYSPASMIADISRTYKFTDEDEDEKIWRPRNYEENFMGLMSARDAVVASRNLTTINLIDSIGIKVLFDKLTTYVDQRLPYDLGVALGSHSISMLDLSHYYTAISNYGTTTKLKVASRVVDRFGFVKEYETQSTEVTKPEQAYLMIDVMRDAVNRGTGRRSKVADIEIAGKTGSTNDYRDAWFVGFTPSTQTIVWFGKDDNSPIAHGATGGVISAPVFSEYYKELLKVRPELKRKFNVPDGVIEIKLANGKKEIFTETSKPPRNQEEQQMHQHEEMLF